jgi:hypothetical protein
MSFYHTLDKDSTKNNYHMIAVNMEVINKYRESKTFDEEEESYCILGLLK